MHEVQSKTMLLCRKALLPVDSCRTSALLLVPNLLSRRAYFAAHTILLHTPSVPKLLQVHAYPPWCEKRLVLVDCGTKAT
jgi:hypothetical protein